MGLRASEAVRASGLEVTQAVGRFLHGHQGLGVVHLHVVASHGLQGLRFRV